MTEQEPLGISAVIALRKARHLIGETKSPVQIRQLLLAQRLPSCLGSLFLKVLESFSKQVCYCDSYVTTTLWFYDAFVTILADRQVWGKLI